jgi:hypothetical protein
VTATHHTIFVLWGHGFDAIAASIFVGELRRMGKRVKLVGLNHQHRTGQHGLTLVPDLSLGQALRAAKDVHCLIVPAPLAMLQQFSYDPRLAELLGLATKNEALLVVDALPAGHAAGDLTGDPHPQPYIHPPFDTLQLLAYPSVEELLSFVPAVLVPRLWGGV